jgi:hypothetical protein
MVVIWGGAVLQLALGVTEDFLTTDYTDEGGLIAAGQLPPVFIR